MFVPLKIPPGVVRGATPQESAGRYYEGNLVRWVGSDLVPIGGWRKRSASAAAMVGVPRAMVAWRDNTQTRWIAVGTHSKLYAQTQGGTLANITPSGFVAGLANATVFTGFGAGPFGVGTFGTPRPDTGASTPATVWSLDNWGEDLVGCAESDGRLFAWSRNTASPATAISGAPIHNTGLVVTDNRFLMALSAGGNPRKVQWCDQEDYSTWTPLATNAAGDLELTTPGALLTGRRVRGRTLILSTADAWSCFYEGPPFIHGFERVGDGCGVVGKAAVAVTGDDQVVWMGRKSFWLFNGIVQPLFCPLQEWLFSNINPAQASKVSTMHNPDFGEVSFHYPSSGSLENDRYVTWCYRTGAWSMGALARTCGVSAAGILQYPIMCSPDGYIYEHEVGVADGAYAESGPLELGNGDQMMLVDEIIPDHVTAGAVSATFYARFMPGEIDQVAGPYNLTTRNDCLFQGREVRVRYGFTGAGKVGIPKLGVQRGDGR